jgi:hypothetical protein
LVSDGVVRLRSLETVDSGPGASEDRRVGNL